MTVRELNVPACGNGRDMMNSVPRNKLTDAPAAHRKTADARQSGSEHRSGCILRFVVTSAESAGVCSAASCKTTRRKNFLKAFPQKHLQQELAAVTLEISLVVRHLLPELRHWVLVGRYRNESENSRGE